MVETAKNLFLFFSALFPIVDPLGGSPIFLVMTRECSPGTRRELSWRIAMNSFFLLVGSYFIGTHILSFFGISLPVVQVGGGSVVIATGWALLKQGNVGEPKEVKQNIQPQRPLPQRILSLDSAPNRGTRIDFRRDHTGRECPVPSRVSISWSFWSPLSGPPCLRSAFFSATDSRIAWDGFWARRG